MKGEVEKRKKDKKVIVIKKQGENKEKREKTMKQILIITVCMLMVSTAYAISDDFESYSVGDTATNWYYENGDPGEMLISNDQSVSPTKSLHLNFAGDGPWGFAHLYAGERIAVGDIAFSFYLDSAEASQWLFFRQFAYDSEENQYIMAEFRITSKNGIQDYVNDYPNFMGDPVSKDTWHTLELKFDHTAETYDLYLDTDLIGNDMAYSRGNNTCETFKMSLGDGRSSAYYNLKAYVDDVSMVVIPEPSLALLGLLVLLKRKKA